jgi:fucose permease
MTIKGTPSAKSNTAQSKSHLPQSSVSVPAVQLNEDVENLEMTARNTYQDAGVMAAPLGLSSSTNAHRLRARIQFTSLCYSMFLAGWNDGTTGPLLPRIQKVYHVGHFFAWCNKLYINMLVVRLDSLLYP